ncbi:MAG: response regulator [Candidatus Marinimicrobia bacterium]|nr:response regulator [Candidatus Neomarinimicrobiota bacterium]
MEPNYNINNNDNRSILIVEDDNSVNKLYQYFLKREFTGTILSASEGQNAIEQCEVHQPELIFMDINMPVRNGIDAVRELRKRGFSNPIVIITSNNIHTENFQHLEVDAILQKPINKIDMIRQLNLIKNKNIHSTC